MRSRQEIKRFAREAMAKQNGTAIVIVLVSLLISGAVGIISARLDVVFAGNAVLFALNQVIYIAALGMTFVMTVNAYGEYIKIWMLKPANVQELFLGFQVNFLRKLGGSLWLLLWATLWSLLFVIPGIIKFCSYFLTMNILADCPNVTARQALKLSMRITDGHKGDIFIWLLSWIGWMLLSFLTCGILYIVYVGPYYFTAYAGLYIEMRDQALAEGRITMADLGKDEMIGNNAHTWESRNQNW